ncbi:Zn(II)2Cys6 transcription factor Ecym_4635 [Eremothecium cymbalariae DBVPG|uniref:Zn(2)-C6 fungal-type domain-containing protein n=1 Tax=Eremothecium cymbalariae (strain CBS 270.75 / DBVPG 7215 / KCTC 17166 / NRRL Y-17582) TaxID=931890 RepID=G8JSD6_ERECY|nr:hypothetical protein Ecym_4635 [Eremothecium cymbalariae DBVPG\
MTLLLGSGKKRKVAKRACLACRKRKIRCDGETRGTVVEDGQRVCSNCANHGLKCIFVRSQRGGRRMPRKKLQHATSENKTSCIDSNDTNRQGYKESPFQTFNALQIANLDNSNCVSVPRETPVINHGRTSASFINCGVTQLSHIQSTFLPPPIYRHTNSHLGNVMLPLPQREPQTQTSWQHAQFVWQRDAGYQHISLLNLEQHNLSSHRGSTTLPNIVHLSEQRALNFSYESAIPSLTGPFNCLPHPNPHVPAVVEKDTGLYLGLPPDDIMNRLIDLFSKYIQPHLKVLPDKDKLLRNLTFTPNIAVVHAMLLSATPFDTLEDSYNVDYFWDMVIKYWPRLDGVFPVIQCSLLLGYYYLKHKRRNRTVEAIFDKLIRLVVTEKVVKCLEQDIEYLDFIKVAPLHTTKISNYNYYLLSQIFYMIQKIRLVSKNSNWLCSTLEELRIENLESTLLPLRPTLTPFSVERTLNFQGNMQETLELDNIVSSIEHQLCLAYNRWVEGGISSHDFVTVLGKVQPAINSSIYNYCPCCNTMILSILGLNVKMLSMAMIFEYLSTSCQMIGYNKLKLSIDLRSPSMNTPTLESMQMAVSGVINTFDITTMKLLLYYGSNLLDLLSLLELAEGILPDISVGLKHPYQAPLRAETVIMYSGVSKPDPHSASTFSNLPHSNPPTSKNQATYQKYCGYRYERRNPHWNFERDCLFKKRGSMLKKSNVSLPTDIWNQYPVILDSVLIELLPTLIIVAFTFHMFLKVCRVGSEWKLVTSNGNCLSLDMATTDDNLKLIIAGSFPFHLIPAEELNDHVLCSVLEKMLEHGTIFKKLQTAIQFLILRVENSDYGNILVTNLEKLIQLIDHVIR